MHCIICGSKTALKFSAKDGANPQSHRVFDIYWCNSCSFGRLGGSFTPCEVASFYPETYYTHAQFNAPERLSGIERLLVHFAWRVDKGAPFSATEVPAGSAACDLGCGNGFAMPILRERCSTVIGIDPDEGALKQASQHGPVFKGSAEELPPEVSSKTFDTVLVSHVLEHCIDPIAAARNVKKLLAPSGTAIIEVPNNDSICFERLRAAWPWSDIPRHLSFFTARSLDLLSRRVGLKVVRTEYVGYLRQFLPKWRDAQSQLAARENISLPSCWGLLLSTAFLPPERKYDSVRVHLTHL